MIQGIETIIDIRKENGFWADLRIINTDKKPVQIHNPGKYSPTNGWETSRESFLIAVLLSFHFLEMNLFVNGDYLVNRNPNIGTNANYIIQRPIELKLLDELKIEIPLHEFYTLEHAENYKLVVNYGNKNLKVFATTFFRFP